jgi:hypothetical protein
METDDLEFFDPLTAADVPWEPVPEYPKGARQKILYEDESRSTRLLEVEAGVRTESVAVHEYHEEVFVVEGSLTDLTLEETFTAGMYASRTPGMEHGPYEYPERCLLFETRHRE